MKGSVQFAFRPNLHFPALFSRNIFILLSLFWFFWCFLVGYSFTFLQVVISL